MAILNNKYNNSMIYTIRSPHTDKFYIGSTTQKLCKRFANHKSDYNAYVNNKGNHITSFKIIELGDSYIELLEEINCENKTQLHMREGELIRIHKDLCTNKIIAGRTYKQYQLDNADKINQYQRKYRFDNPDKIKQCGHQYHLDNADMINQRKKQYRLDNLELIKQQRKQQYLDNTDKKKQYYIDNIDKIKQYKKQHYQNSKTPKINITKDGYDLFVYCDKLMNLQYSYKHFIIV